MNNSPEANSPPDRLARMAAAWLMQTLWPLGMVAAGLPPETPLEEVEALQLLAFGQDEHLDEWVSQRARGSCYRNALFMACEVAARLAAPEQAALAKRYRHCLQALLWRDMAEYFIADELDQISNQSGFPDREFAERALRADQREAAWEQAATATRKALAALWSDYEDAEVWGDESD